MSCALEYHKDFADGKLYASRNVNDVRHTYDANGANRSSLDWNLTLRQGRRAAAKPEYGSIKDKDQRMAAMMSASSMPDLRVAGGNGGQKPSSGEDPPHVRISRRTKELQTREHPDGPYNASTDSVGKFQNYGETGHMLDRGMRVSSGGPLAADWQLNLRDGTHHPAAAGDASPDKQWRRYFTRPQPSFDIMKENCSRDNDAYRNSHITPQDRRPDRLASAISIGTCREETISFRRAEGCEGTEVGQWRHLIDDKSRGHKHKRQMAYETTLRCHPGDPNGSRIADNRSNGCITEMLGKKKWSDAKYERQAWTGGAGQVPAPIRDGNHSCHVGVEDVAGPLRPQDGGDAKMHHLSRSRNILPDRDEKDRGLRKSKHTRKDVDIPEVHPGKPRRPPAEGGASAVAGRSDRSDG